MKRGVHRGARGKNRKKQGGGIPSWVLLVIQTASGARGGLRPRGPATPAGVCGCVGVWVCVGGGMEQEGVAQKGGLGGGGAIKAAPSGGVGMLIGCRRVGRRGEMLLSGTQPCVLQPAGGAGPCSAGRMHVTSPSHEGVGRLTAALAGLERSCCRRQAGPAAGSKAPAGSLEGHGGAGHRHAAGHHQHSHDARHLQRGAMSKCQTSRHA